MKQQDNEAPTALGHRVKTQLDLLNGSFHIQDVKDVFITGLSDLVQVHVRVLNDQFPDRTLSETVATAKMYWDGTNKLRLQLKMTRSTAIKVAHATQDQRKTTERPFTPARTPPLPPAAVPQANRADICYNCNNPGHFAAQCAEPYRPCERRQPPIGVHSIADGNVEELPGGTRKRMVTRLLRRALRHYEIAATLGPCMRVMRSCRPSLDTGAGVNIVRTSVLPANWMAYAEKLTTLPRIRDANNNRLVTKFAINLYVDTGGVRLFDRFLVSDNLTVPCILDTEFIEQNIEAILPRLRKIV